jgi:hypothetical protein
VQDDSVHESDEAAVPLRDSSPWQAAAYAAAAFTPLTAVPLLIADYDNAIPAGIAAGAAVFVLGGLYMTLTAKKR